MVRLACSRLNPPEICKECTAACKRSWPHEHGIGSLLHIDGCAVIWHGCAVVWHGTLPPEIHIPVTLWIQTALTQSAAQQRKRRCRCLILLPIYRTNPLEPLEFNNSPRTSHVAKIPSLKGFAVLAIIYRILITGKIATSPT
jgi:hypothetical protein